MLDNDSLPRPRAFLQRSEDLQSQHQAATCEICEEVRGEGGRAGARGTHCWHHLDVGSSVSSMVGIDWARELKG